MRIHLVARRVEPAETVLIERYMTLGARKRHLNFAHVELIRKIYRGTTPVRKTQVHRDLAVQVPQGLAGQRVHPATSPRRHIRRLNHTRNPDQPTRQVQHVKQTSTERSQIRRPRKTKHRRTNRRISFQHAREFRNDRAIANQRNKAGKGPEHALMQHLRKVRPRDPRSRRRDRIECRNAHIACVRRPQRIQIRVIGLLAKGTRAPQQDHVRIERRQRLPKIVHRITPDLGRDLPGARGIRAPGTDQLDTRPAKNSSKRRRLIGVRP